MVRTRIPGKVRGATGATIVAVLLSMGIGSLASSPASASNSYNGHAYVHGGGTMYTDWYNEGVVNLRVHKYSNATCLWQAILWSNGFLPKSGIDGIFGSQTHSATRAFQRRKGLSMDGSAGRRSWSAAGGISHTVDRNGWVKGVKSGYKRAFSVRRSGAGNYQFYIDGRWHWAAYNYRTCR